MQTLLVLSAPLDAMALSVIGFFVLFAAGRATVGSGRSAGSGVSPEVAGRAIIARWSGPSARLDSSRPGGRHDTGRGAGQ